MTNVNEHYDCDDCAPATPGVDRRQAMGLGLGAGLSALATGGLGLGVTGGILGTAAELAGAQEQPKLKPATADHCIILWMEGGPSHIDTWDPKPGRDTGGPFKPVRTAVPGVYVGEHLPLMAKQMKDLAIIRGMTSREGDHRRGRYFVHTGFPPVTTAQHPSLGAIVAQHRGQPDFDLPNFISLSGASIGSGYLGPENAPFVIPRVDEKGATIANLKAPVDDKRMERRLKLLEDLERDFADQRAEDPVYAHEAMYRKAVRMMRSPLLEAFDLSKEPEEVKARYGMRKRETPAAMEGGMMEQPQRRRNTGRGSFGMGCLLARRLVERGVKVVEVALRGWDTHDDNFNRVAALCDQVDPAFNALLDDLRSRGLLERTLVVWMGEFGRTPKINARGGRDHFPRAFSAVMAGGGVRGGQIIGKTNADGTEVADHPVVVPDLMTSLLHAFQVDPNKKYHAGLRPMQLAKKGAKPVPGLFA
jgi:hypothetical protein